MGTLSERIMGTDVDVPLLSITPPTLQKQAGRVSEQEMQQRQLAFDSSHWVSRFAMAPPRLGGCQDSPTGTSTDDGADLSGPACCAVSPPATPTSKALPLRRQSSLTSSPPMHPALLRASALLAAPPSAAGTDGAVDARRVPLSAPGVQVPAAALLAAQQPHQFDVGIPAPVTVIRPTAAHAVALGPATLPHSAAQPAPPAAYSIMAHAAAPAPAAAAAFQLQLQQLGVSAMALPQQSGAPAHRLLLPERRSVEEWPCSEPAALIRSAFSGPQPLLAAFAEAQFGQVRSISCEGCLQAPLSPAWMASRAAAYCQPLAQPPQPMICETQPQPQPLPQRSSPQQCLQQNGAKRKLSGDSAAAAGLAAAPKQPAVWKAQLDSAGGSAAGGKGISDTRIGDPSGWRRSVAAQCGSRDPEIRCAAQELEATLSDELGHRLRVVCGRLHLGAVAAVLGAGADVASTDGRGRTAVHALAAAQCSSAAAPTAAAILRLLLRRGAQLWARDHAGATPLHVAASRPMMEILLAAAQLQIAASTDAQRQRMETPAEALFRAAHSAAADGPTQGLSNGGGGGGWDASAVKGLFTISAPSVADCSGLGPRKSRSPPAAAQGGLATTSLPAGDLPLFPHSGASGRSSTGGPAAAQGGLGTISAPHVRGPPPCMPQQAVAGANAVVASKASGKDTWSLPIPVASPGFRNVEMHEVGKPVAMSVSPPVTPAAAAISAVRRISHEPLP